jgi:hypothetical protein
MRGKGFW